MRWFIIVTCVGCKSGRPTFSFGPPAPPTPAVSTTITLTNDLAVFPGYPGYIALTDDALVIGGQAEHSKWFTRSGLERPDEPTHSLGYTNSHFTADVAFCGDMLWVLTPQSKRMQLLAWRPSSSTVQAIEVDLPRGLSSHYIDAALLCRDDELSWATSAYESLSATMHTVVIGSPDGTSRRALDVKLASIIGGLAGDLVVREGGRDGRLLCVDQHPECLRLVEDLDETWEVSTSEDTLVARQYVGPHWAGSVNLQWPHRARLKWPHPGRVGFSAALGPESAFGLLVRPSWC